MNIKNYTSSVPMERTIARIESVLVQGGARNIRKDYDADGKISAFYFSVCLPGDVKTMTIRLPADVKAVYDVMRAKVKKPRRGTLANLYSQAERTAWKLLQDWVEIQVAMMSMRQAVFLQVFLPYVWDGKRTFYEALEQQQFKQLKAGEENG